MRNIFLYYLDFEKIVHKYLDKLVRVVNYSILDYANQNKKYILIVNNLRSTHMQQKKAGRLILKLNKLSEAIDNFALKKIAERAEVSDYSYIWKH